MKVSGRASVHILYHVTWVTAVSIDRGVDLPVVFVRFVER